MNSNPGFELHGLQKLFATSVTTVNYSGRFLFDPDVIHEYVIAEVARIKHSLIEKALTIEGEDAARRYVRIHQYCIVAIMDKLFRRSDQPGAMECCDVLDELLSFLNQHFPQYFDDLAKAPLKHIHEVRIDIALSYSLLLKKLVSISTFEEFGYMILDPLDRFYSKGEEQRVSFHRLRFLRYILEHSKKLVQDEPKRDDLDQNFLDLLLYLNYNSRKTFMQFIQFLHDLLPTDLDVDVRHDAFSNFLKAAMQATVKPNTGYHPHAPTLKSQVIDYLTAEVSALHPESHVAEPVEPNRELAIPVKAKFDLSVAQLGCLLRLLTDTGVVSTDNISALIRSVALNCESKRAGQISAESLRKRFYNIEAGTQRAIQERLTELLKSAATNL